MSDGTMAKQLFERFCRESVDLYRGFEAYIKPEYDKLTGLSKKISLKESNFSLPDTKRNTPVVKLDSITKERFETAFDTSLEKVNIHTGDYANELTRKANAEAVTIGSDIYFAQGKFSLDSEEGLLLLAHELQHVIQHKSGKRMTYKEDIAQMEMESNRVEAALQQTNLHGFTGGVLSQSDSPTTEKQQSNSSNQMAVNNIGDSGSIDDFTTNEREIVYRLHVGKKTVDVSRKERDQIIQRTVEKLENRINEERASYSSDGSDEYLLDLLSFMNSY